MKAKNSLYHRLCKSVIKYAGLDATRDKYANETMIPLARKALNSTCKWRYDEDDGCWVTACGEQFCLEDGGPSENGMIFCYHCGKRILEKKPKEI